MGDNNNSNGAGWLIAAALIGAGVAGAKANKKKKLTKKEQAERLERERLERERQARLEQERKRKEQEPSLGELFFNFLGGAASEIAKKGYEYKTLEELVCLVQSGNPMAERIAKEELNKRHPTDSELQRLAYNSPDKVVREAAREYYLHRYRYQ